MNVMLRNIYDGYRTAIQKKANVGNKRLASVWNMASDVPNAAQYFERKILPNGNIKTRMLTIYAENGSPMGLETKVVNPKGDLVYKSIGLVQETTRKMLKNISQLEYKKTQNLITPKEERRLAVLQNTVNKNTKMYVVNDKISSAKARLYDHYTGAKTLVGDTYARFQ